MVQYIGLHTFLAMVNEQLYRMNEVIAGIALFFSFYYSIDASIYIRNNEIVIGSSARQLAQTYPDNVIHHPLCYLDNRKRNPDNEKQTSNQCRYVNDKPVFVIPYDRKEETMKLETVIVECFKKIVDLAELSVNRKPTLTVISGNLFSIS